VIALAATVLVFVLVALPAFALGVNVGRGQRRPRGEVIRPASGFGERPAGDVRGRVGRTPW
jgi:hypothetical protein